MKTITFDEALYKLVPVDPTEAMIVDGFESAPDEFFSPPCTWAEYHAMSGCEKAAHRAELCYAAMLAAVPADLPGVVAHSGGPCAWLEKSAHLDAWFLACSHNSATETKELFTHPPAQPDTAALQARIAELEAEMSKIKRVNGSLLLQKVTGEAQLAAQAGQEPDGWLITCKKPGEIVSYVSIDPSDTHHWPVDERTIVTKVPLYTAPAAPANSVAMLEAFEETHAGLCFTANYLGSTQYEINKTIINKVKKERPANSTSNETSMMAECMDMVRQDLIEAGIIDKAVPPMMVSDAVAAHIGRLRFAIVQAALESALEVACPSGDTETIAGIMALQENPQAILDGMSK